MIITKNNILHKANIYCILFSLVLLFVCVQNSLFLAGCEGASQNAAKHSQLDPREN
jgi:hypothetical protein